MKNIYSLTWIACFSFFKLFYLGQQILSSIIYGGPITFIPSGGLMVAIINSGT